MGWLQALDWGDAPAWSSAVVAVCAAIIAVIYSSRSVAAASRSAAADEGMLQHERTPVFHAEVETPNINADGTGGYDVLVLRLDAPADLDEVTVEILTMDVQFSDGHYGVLKDGERPWRRARPYDLGNGQPRPLQVGDEERWRITSPTGGTIAQGEVVLRVISRAGTVTWKQRVAAPVGRRRVPRMTAPETVTFRQPGS